MVLRIDQSRVRLTVVDTLFRPVQGTLVNSKKWQNQLVIPWADLEMVRWPDEDRMVRYLYSRWTQTGVRL